MRYKKEYRFNVGDKVRVKHCPHGSIGVKANEGKIFTIKARFAYTCAYEVEENDMLWTDGCFELVEAANEAVKEE